MICNNKHLSLKEILLIVGRKDYQKESFWIRFKFYSQYFFSSSLGRIIAVLMFSLFLTACKTLFVLGEKPDITVLEDQLVIGKSTKNDVLQTLGIPFGKGAEMLPFREKPRIMYTYYYDETSMKDSRRIILFVFMADDVYDGYMWFSSLK